ncbi:uncharacterized protein LOC144227628 isoform X2 [Crocuta crocuta]
MEAKDREFHEDVLEFPKTDISKSLGTVKVPGSSEEWTQVTLHTHPDACDLGDLDSDRCVPDPSDRIYPGSWCQNPGSFRSSSWEDAPSARAGSGVSAWDPAA